jgi:hypothetical protein
MMYSNQASADVVSMVCGGSILVQVHGRAIHRPSRNEGVKLVRCLRAASVLQAFIVPTELRGFWRVDTPKPDSGAVNFERVAVDYAGLSGQIVRKRWPGANACSPDEQSYKRLRKVHVSASHLGRQ